MRENSVITFDQMKCPKDKSDLITMGVIDKRVGLEGYTCQECKTIYIHSKKYRHGERVNLFGREYVNLISSDEFGSKLNPVTIKNKKKLIVVKGCKKILLCQKCKEPVGGKAIFFAQYNSVKKIDVSYCASCKKYFIPDFLCEGLEDCIDIEGDIGTTDGGASILQEKKKEVERKKNKKKRKTAKQKSNKVVQTKETKENKGNKENKKNKKNKQKTGKRRFVQRQTRDIQSIGKDDAYIKMLKKAAPERYKELMLYRQSQKKGDRIIMPVKCLVKQKTDNRVKTKMEDEITVRDFVVRQSTFKCKYHSHTIKNINASVQIVDRNGKVIKKTVAAGYCANCNVYFIMESTYQLIKLFGIPLCRVNDERTYYNEFEHDSNNKLNLAKESILMQYGYNVSQVHGLSMMQRQKILEALIDYNVLSRGDIIGYLDFFINQRKNQARFAMAIQKWKEDRDHVALYRIKQYQTYMVGSIDRRSSRK